jgi:hypothetical protein
MLMRITGLLALSVALSASASRCFAGDTVTYNYDANGRLIQSTTTGGAAAGVQDVYTYDAADNITQRTSAGVPPRPTGVIVVPLNGFTIIPVYQ